MNKLAMSIDRAQSLYTRGLHYSFLYLFKMLILTCFNPCFAIISKIIYVQLSELLLALHLYHACKQWDIL